MKQFLTGLSILLLGFAASFWTSSKFFSIETHKIRDAFEEDVQRKIYFLDKEIRINMEILYAVKGVYDASEYVTLEEFREVASSILVRHSGIQALEWVPRVTREERALYEQEMRAVYPDFEVTERLEQGVMVKVPDKDVHYIVYYVEPYAGNEMALGFDNASNPDRLKTLEWSRDTGEFAATGKVTLVQSKNQRESGYIVYVPVYEGKPTTLAARREKLKGFIVAVFRVGYIFQSSLRKAAIENISMHLIDITDPENPQLYYTRELPLEEVVSEALHIKAKLPPIAGRQWMIDARPSKRYVDSRRGYLPSIIFALGASLTLAVAGFVFLILRRNTVIEKTVERRTEQLREAQKELESLARVDGLTGLANRRYFDEYLVREWLRAVREKIPISLAIIDVDNFKRFNDNYGHVEGDQCLKRAADILKVCLHRPADLIARFGGEEFVILLPNTENALPVGNNCRTVVENMQIPHAFSEVSDVVTVSIGVATVIPHRDLSHDFLIKEADKALYNAKDTGKNKVAVAVINQG